MCIRDRGPARRRVRAETDGVGCRVGRGRRRGGFRRADASAPGCRAGPADDGPGSAGGLHARRTSGEPSTCRRIVRGRVRESAATTSWTALVREARMKYLGAVSYTHLRAHETVLDLVCRLLLD